MCIRDRSNSEHLTAVRHIDPGCYLIAEGRAAFERTIGFRPPLNLRLSRLSIQLGIVGYVGAIVLTTLGLLGLALMMLSNACLLYTSRCV